MKKLIYYILPILSVMFVPTSCMDKHDAPVINDNDGSGITASSTIKELKDKYKSVISSDGYQLIEEDALIRGVVVGNDESGNIYKQLFVQDETGGICISIDGNNMNTNFHVGQELAIDCKGLYIGGYGGMAQIGAVYTDSSGKQKIGRMSPFVWDAHHTKIGSATPEKIPAPVVITSANQFKEEYIGKLVSLENVHFDMPGIYTFANYLASEAGTESKTMYFDDDTEVTVRTSRYGSGLASMPLPDGKGKFKGILTIYRGEWQITARTVEDLTDFDFVDLVKSYVNETFASDLGGFTSYADESKETKLEWTIDYSSAIVKGYVDGKNVDAVTYLVSAPVDLSASENAFVIFEHAINYADLKNIAKQHQLLVSNNFKGDIKSATWEVLPIYQADGSSFDFYKSGKVIVPEKYLANGVVFALRHTSTKTKGSTWEVRNFVVAEGEGEIIKDMDDTSDALFYESFADGQGDFTIKNILGNYTWRHDSYGYMKVSGYGSGQNYPNEDWLISPALNISKQNTILTFKHAINFAKNDENRKASCKVYVSTTYNGGDINEADWQEVTIEYPSKDSWSFISSGMINLPVAEKVYVGFRYKCGDADAPTWEVKDFIVK